VPHPLHSHQRQVHLDFHTSPYIPDVASEFDAPAFARAYRDAHVNSVTLFAKCHHGMCYYPTTTGTQHPALDGRDLLGEQLEALHRENIRTPIYTPVGWEEDVARKHPEWLQLRDDGAFARVASADPSHPPQPGGWWYNNFLHPEYQDYIEAHLRELIARYGDAIDGLFFDIVVMAPRACWSDASLRFREKHHLLGRDAATHARFDTAAQTAFARRFTPLVHGRLPAATVFYNSTNTLTTDSRCSVRARHDLQTHWELESLPSGFWGYQHFPRLARAIGHWEKPWLGMTGRFQRMWGDFGGIKPQPALEYECFRTQALGGANSIGDQLPPRGRPDAAATGLIGAVFAQCAAAEPFYAGSTPLPQIGIVAPGDPRLDSARTDLSLEGAIQMCDESHYDAIILDDASPLDPATLALVILPDNVVVTGQLRKNLAVYVRAGGKLIVSHRSGFDGPGSPSLLPGVNLTLAGEVTNYPSYWRARPEFSANLSRSDRVIYEPGVNVEAGHNTLTLVDRILPYFRRTDLTFSSHFQTPPRAAADRYAAVLAGDHYVYFADPIFREYRHSGNIAVRDGWRLAMQRLAGPAPFGEGLPTTILVIPRRRENDLLLTLLHYIPTRKALTVDMIEERGTFAGETLRLASASGATRIIDFVTGSELPRNADGTFDLPTRKGRLLLTVPGFFSIH
jgi:hypothetical protein